MKNIYKFLPFVAVLMMFLLIASGHIESIDGMGSLNIARNIVYKGDLSISPSEYNTGMFSTVGIDGKTYSMASLGYAIMLVPVAFITKVVYALNKFSPATYFPLQSDYLLTFLASFVNPVLGFLLFVVMFLIFKRILRKDGLAFFISFITLFSTNLLPLSKHSFAHILFILLCMASFYMIIRFLENFENKYLLVSGLFAGMLVLAYNITFLLPLGILILCLIHGLISNGARFKQIMKLSVLWLSVVAPFMFMFFYYNYIRFGGFFNFGYSLSDGGDLFIKSDMFEGIWGQLFSPGRSIGVYSPIFVVATFYAIVNFKKDVYSKLLLLVTVLYVLFYSRFPMWSGELSYGPRYVSFLIPFAGIVIASNWKTINKVALYIAVVLGFYVQLLGITVLYQTQYPLFDLKIISLPKVMDRESVFQYWSVGEFWPRFSPPYRLKRVLTTRLGEVVTIMLSRRNPVEFVKNASLPTFPEDVGDVRGRPYKHLLSSFFMEGKTNLSFQDMVIEVGSVNQELKTIKLCIEESCYVGRQASSENRKYSFNFDNSISVKRGDVLKFVINEDAKTKNNFELDIYSLSFGNFPIDVLTYNSVNKDSFFTRDSLFFTPNLNFDYLWSVRNTDFEGLYNITPDFWWIRAKVFFNLPVYFLGTFYGILLIFVGSISSYLIYKFIGYKRNK